MSLKHPVKNIYCVAFYGCKNLKVVDLGSVEELGEGVFGELERRAVDVIKAVTNTGMKYKKVRR